MDARSASDAELLRISRRVFLGGLAGLLISPTAPAARARAAGTPGAALPAAATRALESSPFVYVSPLRSDGSESACHGEVWFGWIDGAVVLITSEGTWKARSAARGLDRARIWVVHCSSEHRRHNGGTTQWRRPGRAGRALSG